MPPFSAFREHSKAENESRKQDWLAMTGHAALPGEPGGPSLAEMSKYIPKRDIAGDHERERMMDEYIQSTDYSGYDSGQENRRRIVRQFKAGRKRGGMGRGGVMMGGLGRGEFGGMGMGRGGPMGGMGMGGGFEGGALSGTQSGEWDEGAADIEADDPLAWFGGGGGGGNQGAGGVFGGGAPSQNAFGGGRGGGGSMFGTPSAQNVPFGAGRGGGGAQPGHGFNADSGNDPLAGWGDVNIAAPQQAVGDQAPTQYTASVASFASKSGRSQTQRTASTASYASGSGRSRTQQTASTASYASSRDHPQSQRQPQQAASAASWFSASGSTFVTRVEEGDSVFAEQRRGTVPGFPSPAANSGPSQKGQNTASTPGSTPTASFTYPQNDNRLPPPGTACPKPICLRDASGKPKWWFNLTYNNPSPSAVQLHISTSSSAQKAWAAKKRSEDGTTQDAKMAVVQAIQMTKEMKEISDGPRGKVYAVKKRCEWVVGACLEGGSMQGMRWRVLGVGVKAFEGWVFMLGER